MDSALFSAEVHDTTFRLEDFLASAVSVVGHIPITLFSHWRGSLECYPSELIPTESGQVLAREQELFHCPHRQRLWQFALHKREQASVEVRA
jgi:hypothetical protein